MPVIRGRVKLLRSPIVLEFRRTRELTLRNSARGCHRRSSPASASMPGTRRSMPASP